jgi:hypothetical protein
VRRATDALAVTFIERVSVSAMAAAWPRGSREPAVRRAADALAVTFEGASVSAMPAAWPRGSREQRASSDARPTSSDLIDIDHAGVVAANRPLRALPRARAAASCQRSGGLRPATFGGARQ